MDWTQIEKDFGKALDINPKMHPKIITNWFKQRIEAEQSKQQNEAVLYTTNVTAEIKPNYGK